MPRKSESWPSDRADRSLWGIRTFNGICTLGPHSVSRTRTGMRSTRWPYGEVALRSRCFSRTVSSSRCPSARSTASRNVRDHAATASLLAGDATPLKQFDFGTGDPVELRVQPGQTAILLGARISRVVSNIFRYEIATGRLEASDQRRNTVLPAGAAARDGRRSWCSVTRGTASCRQ
jgi:hypothetical protein